jgi:hypothetical protein
MDTSFQGNMAAFASGGQANGTPITRTYSRFVTVATTGDSCTLPSASPLSEYTIKNAGANSMNVFPNPTPNLGVWNPAADQINAAGANVPFTLASGKTCVFVCMQNGYWDTVLSA